METSNPVKLEVHCSNLSLKSRGCPPFSFSSSAWNLATSTATSAHRVASTKFCWMGPSHRIGFLSEGQPHMKGWPDGNLFSPALRSATICGSLEDAFAWNLWIYSQHRPWIVSCTWFNMIMTLTFAMFVVSLQPSTESAIVHSRVLDPVRWWFAMHPPLRLFTPHSAEWAVFEPQIGTSGNATVLQPQSFDLLSLNALALRLWNYIFYSN